MGRPRQKRRYRKVFVIGTEGKVTEPNCFKALRSLYGNLKILPCKRGHSDALHIAQQLAGESKGTHDSFWLVCDKDHIDEAKWKKIVELCSINGINIALSNPCFEYWLLLHYVQAGKTGDVSSCVRAGTALKQKVEGYEKNQDQRFFETHFIPHLKTAIDRAETEMATQQARQPFAGRGTTMYQLMREIISAAGALTGLDKTA